nr:helix-turn-helix transcriptional regulator [Streptomyces antioxidans]
MDRDWAEPLDLGAVAAHAGYSRYHFIRAFRGAYGSTPGQYLTRRRIERAEELLRSANLSVTEICSLVGFSSLGTFSTSFKRQTGLTPSAYRDMHVDRAAAVIPGCYAMLWYGGRDARAPGSDARGSRAPAPRGSRAPAPGAKDRNSREAD